MDTIIDYILWMRDFPFTTVPFREADALVLCMLSYFDYSDLFEDGDSELPLSRAKTLLDRGPVRVEIVGPDMGYQAILAAAADSVRYGSLLLGNYVDLLQDEPPLQFAAMTFQGHGERFLAFRGTDSSLAGWQEDFMTSFTHTPSQELALDCARRLLRPGERWRMGGHSKGGNLCLYAACALPRTQTERLESIYLLDAPGLCPEVVGLSCMEGMEEKIVRVIPQFCVVGKIFEPKVPNTRIVRSTAVGLMQHALSTWGIDHGALALAESCDPVSMRLEQAQSKWINGLSREERVIFFNEVFEALGSGGARTMEELAAEGLNGYKGIRNHIHLHASETTKRILADLPRQALLGGLSGLHRQSVTPVTPAPHQLLKGRVVGDARGRFPGGGERNTDKENT